MRHPDEQEPGVTRSDATHPDEGTIHAWLDGALAPAEAAALERHVAACATCAAAVAEARGFAAAASRILGALDAVPGDVIPVADTAASAAAAVSTAPAADAPPADGRTALRLERGGGGATPAAHRRRRWRGWPVSAAAVALLAVGSWAVIGELGGVDRAVRSAGEVTAGTGTAGEAGAATDAAAAAPQQAPVAEASPADSVRVAPASVSGFASADSAAPVGIEQRRSRVGTASGTGAGTVPSVVRGRPPAAKAAPETSVTGATPFAAAAPQAAGAPAAAEALPAPPPPPVPPQPVTTAGARATPVLRAPPPAPVPGVSPARAPAVASSSRDLRREAAPAAAPQADVAVMGQAGRTLAGCYRVELDGAPTSAEARRVEGALRGWIRLTTVSAPDRGWLVAAPTTPAAALRDERALARGADLDSVAARPAPAPARAAGARWRERPDGGADVEWPAAGGPLRLELRPHGDALAGAATVPGGSAPVPVTLRAAACAVPPVR